MKSHTYEELGDEIVGTGNSSKRPQDRKVFS